MKVYAKGTTRFQESCGALFFSAFSIMGFNLEPKIAKIVKGNVHYLYVECFSIVSL